ncbi:putative hydrolase [Gordonia hirsuta DSM 44140 = NBRC 16056]|uniref:Putative hydrolase n=1 Tax=Gordonia hirsuta DSM 44140 = NBRC 16056 TaxID=1121927 RepID=L7LEW5_9ACTN|nr:P1 family peptidase [Gordonia hirsuta]GAC58612.1 putative hydrolase [Gordonia hirsuta DSM 44140 = NBRC 16056]
MSRDPGEPASPGDRITEVSGLAVGHHQRLDAQVAVGTLTEAGSGWATGTTVVVVPDGSTTAVDVRGGGPGTRETDLLAPENTVQGAHALVLSGGSAYGLAAADGVMAALESAGRGLPMDLLGHVVPIVPAAVIFDLPVGGWDRRPDAGFGAAALAAAGPDFAVGTVGAGTGARAGALKGGVGTASIRLGEGPAQGLTVGVLVVANPVGAVIDPVTGLPWGGDDLAHHGLSAPDPAQIQAHAALQAKATMLNTTIGVVATDAQLSTAATRRLAMSGHDGLARAIRPAHSPMDGDTLFAVATGQTEAAADRQLPMPPGMDPQAPLVAQLCEAAAVVTQRAVVGAVLAATAVGSVPAYRDVLDSALSRRDRR